MVPALPLVGDPKAVAARIQEYHALGIDTFIFSGYPHLEEAYRLLLPELQLGRNESKTESVLTG